MAVAKTGDLGGGSSELRMLMEKKAGWWNQDNAPSWRQNLSGPVTIDPRKA